MAPESLRGVVGAMQIDDQSQGLDSKEDRCWNARLDTRWDAGEMGCGQLVVELRRRLVQMTPGETLEVTAQSPGAPADIPAWCRMTGHTLVSADHPVYVIRRKAD